jgi:uncharacterized SAM-binding protein YcdF (DUF218 family)
MQFSLALMLVPTIVYPVLGGIFEGRRTSEKILTAWCLPLGVVWLLLFALVLFLWNQRLISATRFALVCFLALTVASNSFVSSWLMASLEGQYQPWRLDRDEPLDAVVVLGGGTNSSPHFGRVQGNDRVLYGAELYHQKKTPLLIATGKASVPGKHDPSVDTKALWMRLGIPDSAIEVIGGPNTFAEMQEVKKLLGDSPTGRIGLLTSAFHLPRAMRLAKSAGLDLIPLAADHYYDPDGPIRFQSFMPSEQALATTHVALKEHLATLIGR